MNCKVKKLICGGIALSIVMAGFGMTEVSDIMPGVGLISASAEVFTGSCGENVTYTLDNGVLTISGTGDMEEYAAGRSPWFHVADMVTDIIVKSGVTSVGSGSFYGFSAIRNVTIENTVVTIGDYAFSSSDITAITLPDSVLEIGEGAFCDCLSLDDVDLGSSVLTIGDSAFAGCKKISRFKLSPSISYIGAKVFEDTPIVKQSRDRNSLAVFAGFLLDGKGVSGDVTIPDSIKHICGSAFEYCTGVTSITIPAGIDYIGDRAFADCTDLASVTFSGNVDSIGMGAFAGCSSLGSIALPNGIANISEGMFADCTSLSDIAFSSTINEISANAFTNCTALSTVDFPSGIVSIGSNAFGGCTSLQTITFPEDIEYISGNAFDSTRWFATESSRSPLVIVNNILVSGKNARGQIDIPENIVSISDYAFEGNSAVTSVFIPDKVEMIGEKAFFRCSHLKSAAVPDSAAHIGDLSFGYITDQQTGDYVKDTNFTLFCGEGSAAEKYADVNGITKEITKNDGTTAMKLRLFKYDSTVTPDNARVSVYKGNSKVKEAVPAQNGYVDLSGLAEGSYDVVITCPGYAERKIPYQAGGCAGELKICKYGDLNGNGVIDNEDLSLMQQYISEWRVSFVYDEVADLKWDHEVNNEDLSRLQQMLSGWNVSVGKPV